MCTSVLVLEDEIARWQLEMNLALFIKVRRLSHSKDLIPNAGKSIRTRAKCVKRGEGKRNRAVGALTRSVLGSSLFELLIARGGDVGGRFEEEVDLCFGFGKSISQNICIERDGIIHAYLVTCLAP